MNTTITFFIGFLGGVIFTLAGVQHFVKSMKIEHVLSAVKGLRGSRKK